jgi:2-polyprenyl-3-methyl-5-hydroxy-6-metoxy-1,4-benzoquinol methylase
MSSTVINTSLTKSRAERDEACRGCQSTRRRLLGHKSGYELFHCLGCGTVSTMLPLDSAVQTEIYRHHYEEAPFEAPQVTAASLDRLVASFEPFRITGRWLDVGYGEGGLLTAADHRGWNCHGTEVAVRALEYGTSRGWVVGEAADGDPRFPQHGFDVVTMIEFLEHVSKPEEFLKAALRWLRPGGILYLTTPNAQSLNHRLLGLGWSIFCPPDHLTIWTARGLRAALSGAGFKCRRIRTDGLNPCEIIARFRRNDKIAGSINRQQAAANLNSVFSSSPFRRTVKSGINTLLSAFRAGDGIKVWATPEVTVDPPRLG